MYTPEEIMVKKFDKTVLGGLDSRQVDNFLMELATQIADLNKINADLTAKSRVLVRTVEEYRQREASINSQIEEAKRQAAEIVNTAQRKCEEIMLLAKAATEKKIAQYREEIRSEEIALENAKKDTAQFVTKVGALYAEHVKALSVYASTEQKQSEDSSVPEFERDPTIQDLPGKQDEKSFIKEIARSVDNGLSSEEDSAQTLKPRRVFDGVRIVEAGADITPTSPKGRKDPEEEENEEGQNPRPKFDFNNLQFGRDFRI